MSQSVGQPAPQTTSGRNRVTHAVGIAVVGIAIALVALVATGVVAFPGQASAQAGASAANPPADVVQRHYAELAAREYESAWQQLSPSQQKQLGYGPWVNSYTSSRITPTGLEFVSQTPTAATVVGAVTVTSSGGASMAGRGRWTLSLIDGVWRLDSTSYEGVGSAR